MSHIFCSRWNGGPELKGQSRQTIAAVGSAVLCWAWRGWGAAQSCCAPAGGGLPPPRWPPPSWATGEANAARSARATAAPALQANNHKLAVGLPPAHQPHALLCKAGSMTHLAGPSCAPCESPIAAGCRSGPAGCSWGRAGSCWCAGGRSPAASPSPCCSLAPLGGWQATLCELSSSCNACSISSHGRLWVVGCLIASLRKPAALSGDPSIRRACRLESWCIANTGRHIARIRTGTLSCRDLRGVVHLAVYSSPGRALSTGMHRAFSRKPEGRRVARRGACCLSPLHSCHQRPQLREWILVSVG